MGYTNIEVLPVGQGMCSLIQGYDDNEGLVFLAMMDCGTSRLDEDGSNTCKGILVNYIRSQMALRAAAAGPRCDYYMDLIVISHGDEDHHNLIQDVFDGLIMPDDSKKISELGNIQFVKAVDDMGYRECGKIFDTQGSVHHFSLSEAFHNQVFFLTPTETVLADFLNGVVHTCNGYHHSMRGVIQFPDFTCEYCFVFFKSYLIKCEYLSIAKINFSAISMGIELNGFFTWCLNYGGAHVAKSEKLKLTPDPTECWEEFQYRMLKTALDFLIFLAEEEMGLNLSSCISGLKAVLYKQMYVSNFLSLRSNERLMEEWIQIESGAEERCLVNSLIFGGDYNFTSSRFINPKVERRKEQPAKATEDSFNIINKLSKTCNQPYTDNLWINPLAYDGLQIRCYKYPSEFLDALTPSKSANATSLLTLISTYADSGFQVLGCFPGDLTQNSMHWISNHIIAPLGVPVPLLIAPHHGSLPTAAAKIRGGYDTTDINNFLSKAVLPRRIIVSASHNSQHGHPQQLSMQLYRDYLRGQSSSTTPHKCYFNTTNSGELRHSSFMLSQTSAELYTTLSAEGDTNNLIYKSYTVHGPDLSMNEDIFYGADDPCGKENCACCMEFDPVKLLLTVSGNSLKSRIRSHDKPAFLPDFII